MQTLFSTGERLYLGGECIVPTNEGGSALRAARSDRDFAWRALGSGTNGRVRAFAVFQDQLYVGGDFSAVGGKSSPFLARWEDLGPVPVQLAHLDGRREDGVAVLRWVVGSSFEHAGFHVYRNDTTPEARITEQRLLAPDGVYELRDPLAPAAETYYWIEEISRDGDSTWFGPVVVPAGRGPDLGHAEPRLVALGPMPFRTTTRLRLYAPFAAANGPAGDGGVGAAGIGAGDAAGGAGVGTAGAALGASSGAEIRAEVYDVLGRRVRTLFRGPLTAAEVDFVWDGRNDAGQTVAAALYFVRVSGPNWSRSARVLTID